MTRTLAIDPGTVQSAWVLLDGETPVDWAIDPNDDVVRWLRHSAVVQTVDQIVVEDVQSYGMPVGREVFEMVRWSGRFQEAIEYRVQQPVFLEDRRVEWITRLEVKTRLCGSAKAKDPNVRQAVLDRYGGSNAKGTKAHPGPLYGFKADLFAALAVGLAFLDKQREGSS